jgi:hypothetical protein
MEVEFQTRAEDGGNCVPPKHWYLPTIAHGVTTQKVNTDNSSLLIYLFRVAELL